MQNMSLEYVSKDPSNSFFQNKSAIDLSNKRELAYEEKKKRRDLYNKELFGSDIEKNKDYNPFYDNSYLHNNISNSQVFAESEPQNQENQNQEKSENKERKNDKKDQMIQTDEHFFGENSKKVDFLKEKKPEKARVAYKPFFEEQTDHRIFQKIKEDYQSFVRNDGKNNRIEEKNIEKMPMRYNLHKGRIEQKDLESERPNNEGLIENLGKKYKKNTHSLEQMNSQLQRKKDEQKAYAEELSQMVKEKSQRKHVEKEKNNLLSVKLLREGLENSPFGRAGGGAPNRDSSGNLLLKKGIYVNDNLILYKDNGSRINESLIPENYQKYQSLERNLNDSYEENLRNNNPNTSINNISKIYDQNDGSNPQNYAQNNQNFYNNNDFNSPQFNQINPQFNQMNSQFNQAYNPQFNAQFPPGNNNQFNQGINQYNQRNIQYQGNGPQLIQGNNQYYPQNPQYNQNQNQEVPLYPSQNDNNYQEPNKFVQMPQQTPNVPKVLDMMQIEKEFLLQTEYKRTYAKNGQNNNNIDFAALKNSHFLTFQEYDKQEQIRRYQEQIQLQKILYDQIEDKRRKKEDIKQGELMKQQQEENRLKRQREEIIEKYNKDMEKKMLELQNIKDTSINKSLLKPKEMPKEMLKEIPRIFSENKEENQDGKFVEELKRKEEEKLIEIQKQKSMYEEKLESVNYNLIGLKNQLFSQQNMLNEELNKLKAEALMSNEQRFRAQRDLENLREDLKKQELMEELRRNELTQALIKNKPMNNYSDPSNIIYPKFARDFNKAFRFHQINNEYINDSLDNLVQRTNFIPIVDYDKPLKSENFTVFKNKEDDFDYSNSLTQATKVQTLPSSLVKGYAKGDDFNAMDLLKNNEERLEELKRLDKSDGVDMQSRLDNLINDFNKK